MAVRPESVAPARLVIAMGMDSGAAGGGGLARYGDLGGILFAA